MMPIFFMLISLKLFRPFVLRYNVNQPSFTVLGNVSVDRHWDCISAYMFVADAYVFFSSLSHLSTCHSPLHAVDDYFAPFICELTPDTHSHPYGFVVDVASSTTIINVAATGVVHPWRLDIVCVCVCVTEAKLHLFQFMSLQNVLSSEKRRPVFKVGKSFIAHAQTHTPHTAHTHVTR